MGIWLYFQKDFKLSWHLLFMKETEKLIEFNKKSRIIKLHSIEGWGPNPPCPIRFVVNPYMGCEFRCPYCYVWYHKGKARCIEGFRESLKKDILLAKKFGLNRYVVEVSSSTDPFQRIELIKGDSLFAIKELLSGGFKVMIVTKNPSFLLLKKYSGILKNKNLFVDVTITSLKEGTKYGNILNNKGPSAKEKIDSIKKIIKKRKNVRVKIDPIIPTAGSVIGQSKEDLEELVKELSKIGVKTIIAKTLRLNVCMPDYIKEQLIEFYKKNGTLMQGNYTLNKDLRKKMLEPLYQASKKNNINFCACVDADVFNDKKIISCNIKGETFKKMGELKGISRTGV